MFLRGKAAWYMNHILNYTAFVIGIMNWHKFLGSNIRAYVKSHNNVHTLA